MNEKKSIYLVCGQPASGKSSFALTLAKRLSACLIDIDSTTEPIIQAAMSRLNGNPDDRDSPLFKSTFREPIHQTLFSIALLNLPINHVVIAAPFTKEQRDPNWIDELKHLFGTDREIVAIYTYCDAAILKKRLESRGNKRDKSKLKQWDTYQAYYRSERPAFPHLAVDTSLEGETQRAIETLTQR